MKYYFSRRSAYNIVSFDYSSKNTTEYLNDGLNPGLLPLKTHWLMLSGNIKVYLKWILINSSIQFKQLKIMINCRISLVNYNVDGEFQIKSLVRFNQP